jgi:hypothetical protein
MRNAPSSSSGLSLLFSMALPALLVSGCATTHQFAGGNVSYTSTPPIADHSGALPLSTLVCVDDGRLAPKFSAGIRLGSCQLAGFDHWRHPRGGVVSGETEIYAVGGECALPTSAGPVPLTVQSATLQYAGDGVDITVGGTTRDGRYMTYRFTGLLGAQASGDECEALLDAKPIN